MKTYILGKFLCVESISGDCFLKKGNFQGIKYLGNFEDLHEKKNKITWNYSCTSLSRHRRGPGKNVEIAGCRDSEGRNFSEIFLSRAPLNHPMTIVISTLGISQTESKMLCKGKRRRKRNNIVSLNFSRRRNKSCV